MSCLRCGVDYPETRVAGCPVCLLEGEGEPALLNDGLELLEEVGRGGMGAVHRARHRALDRIVAVKLLPPELAADAEFLARFEREAKTLGMLSHPNIVAVHDAGHSGGQPYIVMEFVDGEPLSKKLPLPSDRVVELSIQVGEALAYAHGRGVIHRDIKPENILVDTTGRAKVTDFGIARITGAKAPAVTGSGVVLGTPQYIAPEALDGAAPDARMDVFSLGVVMHEMITGKLPAGQPEPLPPRLDPIVKRAMASDPARRYPDIASMLADLRGLAGRDDLDHLPPDEIMWVRAVAMLQSVSTTVALWAFLECVKPKVIDPKDTLPLVMIGQEKLADGRIVSRARFETFPAIATLGTFAVAIFAYGLLRRHWRLAGLEQPRPDRPIAESKIVLVIGALACALYGVHLALNRNGLQSITQFIPPLGAAIEIAVLYYVWITILKAWRVSRPLRREPLLWIGFTLALIPPATQLLQELTAWKP